MNYKRVEKQLQRLLKNKALTVDESTTAETWQQIAQVSIEMLLNANKQNERMISLLEMQTERCADHRKEAWVLAGKVNELQEELAQCNLELLYAARRIYSIN